MEREGYAFPVEVEYKWLPDFCTHCQIVGLSITKCRWLHPEKVLNKDRNHNIRYRTKGNN